MKFVGIDQSLTHFAMVMLDEECKIIKKEVFKTDKKGAARLKLLRDSCLAFLELDDEPNYLDNTEKLQIGLEGYSFGSKGMGIFQLGELGGVIRLALEDRDIKPLIIPPTMVKKYACGKGNVQKNQILLNVYKNWGIEFKDDNEADAFVIANIVKEWYSETNGLLLKKYQVEVISALRKET